MPALIAHHCRVAAVLVALLCLSACASLVGPRDVSIPLSKLQAGVERRFPLHNKAIELLDVQLSNPRLFMQADSDRVGLRLDALVAPPFIKQSWGASLALSGRLSIDVARGDVFLNDPRLDQLSVDGADGGRQQQFTALVNVLLKQSMRELPVYHFQMEDLRYGGVQFVPTAIRTSADALVIHVEPVR
ncbi:DUF1439 domain-containing protein [Massilia sp. PWRC2]|uniref:DUF1439 domain-containing protein n=1 Tax=Massilia sp. PWRC2 TaxID=2804626 RepID=UPI003CF5BB04